jgi:hypothetical protein
MSRTDSEEREEFKRFVSAAISKPELEEEEEFKFLSDLSFCTYMNRKGLEPILCDYWSQQQVRKIPEFETVDVHILPPSGLLPPKSVILRSKPGYGVVKVKPGPRFETVDPYLIRVKLKAVPEFETEYYHLEHLPKTEALKSRFINKHHAQVRAGYEKAYRSYLPPEMNSLLNTINKSRSLLELKDNWDGEGSVGYAEATWLRARNFLMRNAVRLYQSQKKSFDPPEFEPGPNGSIDLHWKTDARELLVNVPADPQETISYYGDDRVEDTENAIRGKNIEGSTNTEWIFLWLTQ